MCPEEIRFLRESLLADNEARRHYIDYMMVHSSLFMISAELSTETGNESMDAINKALLDLSEYEKRAPGVEIPVIPKEPEADEAPAEIKKVRFKVSKFSIISLVLSSAALIFIIAYAHFISVIHGVEVATLTDSVNATWADPALSIQNNTRLSTGQQID